MWHLDKKQDQRSGTASSSRKDNMMSACDPPHGHGALIFFFSFSFIYLFYRFLGEEWNW